MNTRLTFFILWFEKDISNPVSEKLKRPFFGSESLDTGKKVETNAPSILYFFFFFFFLALFYSWYLIEQEKGGEKNAGKSQSHEVQILFPYSFPVSIPLGSL